MSPQHAALGDAVRELRKEHGMSQEDLGHASGLHRNYIGGIERGELNLSFASIIKLAAALHVNPSDLLAEGERRERGRRPGT